MIINYFVNLTTAPNNIRLYLTCVNYKIRASATPGTYYSGFISKMYQYQGTGTPTEFIAEDSTERDYYTKQETNNLLDKKQDKLTAGTNITIDKNNVISASGGGVDPNNYYTKPEVDKKLEDKLDIDKFQYAFTINALGIENPNLETTNKTVVGAINENKSNIDKKQDKLTAGDNITIDKNNKISAISNNETWKKVGTISDDKQKITYQFKQNTFYRVGYSAGTDLKTGYGSVKYITFKHISTNNEDILLDSLIDKVESNITSWIDLVINRNGYIYLDKHNWNIGFLYDLEEGKTEETYEIRSNTLEIKKSNNIDITKPLNIKSETLKITSLAENTFDIELKENPTPCPCPKWKEVGKVIVDKNNLTHIEYIFKDKTHYRIYYSFGDYTSKEDNKNYSWQIINFYYQLDTNVLKSSLWISNNNVNADTEINIYNNRIMWGMGRDYIFKRLEELQE